MLTTHRKKQVHGKPEELFDQEKKIMTVSPDVPWTRSSVTYPCKMNGLFMDSKSALLQWLPMSQSKHNIFIFLCILVLAFLHTRHNDNNLLTWSSGSCLWKLSASYEDEVDIYKLQAQAYTLLTYWECGRKTTRGCIYGCTKKRLIWLQPLTQRKAHVGYISCLGSPLAKRDRTEPFSTWMCTVEHPAGSHNSITAFEGGIDFIIFLLPIKVQSSITEVSLLQGVWTLCPCGCNRVFSLQYKLEMKWRLAIFRSSHCAFLPAYLLSMIFSMKWKELVFCFKYVYCHELSLSNPNSTAGKCWQSIQCGWGFCSRTIKFTTALPVRYTKFVSLQ
jgi:hypothetical protein